jgi:hydrogenase maturation protease
MPGKTLFVGVGSPHGDDRAGWLVADALSDLIRSDAPTPANGNADHDGLPLQQNSFFAIRKTSIPADLLDWIDGRAKLIICDAFCGAGPTGTLYRWPWPDERIGLSRSAGSHDFGLHVVLQLADKLGRLPAEVVVWGIELGQVAPYTSVSQEIEEALPVLIQRIRSELGHA